LSEGAYLRSSSYHWPTMVFGQTTT
jgi:hypothetical protein